MRTNLAMLLSLLLALATSFSGCKKTADTSPVDPAGSLQLLSAKVGGVALSFSDAAANTGLPFDQPLLIEFAVPVDTARLRTLLRLTGPGGAAVPAHLGLLTPTQVSLGPDTELEPGEAYTLAIGKGALGTGGEVFAGTQTSFTTKAALIALDSVRVDSRRLTSAARVTGVGLKPAIVLYLSRPAAPLDASAIILTSSYGGSPATLALSADGRRITATPTDSLHAVSRYTVSLGGSLRGRKGELPSAAGSYAFYTRPGADRFARISDDALLDVVQSRTLKYFTEGADPVSGMAQERNTSPDVLTTGGAGFGVMALIVGVERGFISRAEAVDRWNRITRFLARADRFHGAWPHWFYTESGHVKPFSPNDNGGDLVETSFMAQGLITVRQYLDRAAPPEAAVAARIDSLLDGIEWDWYRQQNQQNVLYWHWSPDKAWIMNFPLHGWNETLITYVMAAASRTHSIPRPVYEQGYCTSDRYANGRSYYGYTLPLGPDGGKGGPLFFAHYSFLGLNPTRLQDAHANYRTQNVNHSKINYSYCVANPLGYPNYGPDLWGLTASDNDIGRDGSGYSAHDPDNDLGVISPTAALSSMPYTPDESLRALRFFYYKLGDRLLGPHGFYDAYDANTDKVIKSYLAIDQGPIVVMIENYRTGKLWNLFMSAPEVQSGLTRLGFTF